jgi:cytidylate kinase
MPVITISRQYGSGAVRVAQRLCEVLGYSYFDKDLMVRTAAEMGVSEENVVDFSEDIYRMRNFFERLFGRRRMKPEEREAPLPESALQVETLSEADGIDLVRDTILAAYDRDNVVILGRGGQAILREKPGVLHVRLGAPLGARAMRVKERSGRTLAEATALAKAKDQAAIAYLVRFFDIDWNNPLLYHLVFNSGKWELSDIAEIIIDSLAHLRTASEHYLS